MLYECASRTSLCRAVCCSFRFALTREEAESGIIRHDEAHPFFIARGADGYCTGMVSELLRLTSEERFELTRRADEMIETGTHACPDCGKEAEVEAEREPVQYGIPDQLRTFNPVRIAFHEWAAMFGDAWRARNWRDRLGYVLRHPGWKPSRG